MTIYFVLGGVLVAWALILTALGLRRDDFPPSRSAGRRLMAFAGLGSPQGFADTVYAAGIRRVLRP